MNTTFPMHPEVARHEIARRLRAADDGRRRRLARRRFLPVGRTRSGGTMWR